MAVRLTEKAVDIDALFRQEFGSLANYFDVVELSVQEVPIRQDDRIVRPGVYVFHRDGQVYLIGRHFVNASRRALEHLKEDTSGQLRSLEDASDSYLLLFTTPKDDHLHWLTALEVFFERNLNPLIHTEH